MRFLLFDRIVDAEPGRRLEVVKHAGLLDGYFPDHFPMQPVMPASLLIEGLAQAGGMLNCLNHDFAVEMVLMLIDGVRIHRQVTQGETLTLEVRMLYDHPYGATMSGEARVGDDTVLTAGRIAFAHEIVPSVTVVERNRERFAYQGGRVLPPPDGAS